MFGKIIHFEKVCYHYASPQKRIAQSFRLLPTLCDNQRVLDWAISVEGATITEPFTDGAGDRVCTMTIAGRFQCDTITVNGVFKSLTIGKFRFEHEAGTMVKSIVSVARSLGLKVTAECVEKEEEFIALREAGCDYAQGYYFMRPDSLESAMSLTLNH